MFMDKRCYEIAKEEHYCPHCKERLSCCHTPPYHVGDGLGWGTEIFFVCLNDECPIFNRSWEEFEERYGQVSSCRYMTWCPGYRGCDRDNNVPISNSTLLSLAPKEGP